MWDVTAVATDCAAEQEVGVTQVKRGVRTCEERGL